MSTLQVPRDAPEVPGRRGPLGWALVTLGLLLAAVCVAGVVAAALAGLVRQENTGGELVRGVTRGVDDVKGCGGDVDLRPGGAGSTVEVSWRDRSSFGPPRHRQDVVGGTLSVRVECTGTSIGWSATSDLAVTVPDGVPVTVSTGYGDVDAEGLTGRTDITTGAGDVTVDGASEELALDSGAGDVSVTRFSGGTAELSSGIGDLELFADEAPDRLVADAGAGDVTVVVPDGDAGYDVSTDLGAGSARIDVTDDPSSPRRMTLSAGIGTITVYAQDGGR